MASPFSLTEWSERLLKKVPFAAHIFRDEAEDLGFGKSVMEQVDQAQHDMTAAVRYTLDQAKGPTDQPVKITVSSQIASASQQAVSATTIHRMLDEATKAKEAALAAAMEAKKTAWLTKLEEIKAAGIVNWPYRLENFDRYVYDQAFFPKFETAETLELTTSVTGNPYSGMPGHMHIVSIPGIKLKPIISKVLQELLSGSVVRNFLQGIARTIVYQFRHNYGMDTLPDENLTGFGKRAYAFLSVTYAGKDILLEFRPTREMTPYELYRVMQLLDGYVPVKERMAFIIDEDITHLFEERASSNDQKLDAPDADLHTP